MTTHTSIPAGQSQCQAILARLQARPGSWVAMPTLVRVSGAYAVHSRIADLRARGHRIQQRSLRRNRQVKSFYRLIPQASS